MTLAEQFSKEAKNKYGADKTWFSSYGERTHVKYELTFYDNSYLHIVMTDPQFCGLRRSKLWSTIRTTLGLGYVTTETKRKVNFK